MAQDVWIWYPLGEFIGYTKQTMANQRIIAEPCMVIGAPDFYWARVDRTSEF